MKDRLPREPDSAVRSEWELLLRSDPLIHQI
jgi:hypothetical protein